MSTLYGSGTEFISGLGGGQVDTYGEGYDVVTSAQVDAFASGKDLRVYYEGKHSDFTDTDDIVNGTEGIFDMSASESDRGSNWESEVDGNYGPGQEPGFFIEVSGKKLAVTFDKEKGDNGEWKVDTSSIKVAEDASAVIKGVDKTTTQTTETKVFDGSTITGAGIDVVGSVATTSTIDTYTASDLVSYGIDAPGARTTIDMYSGEDLINAGVVAEVPWRLSPYRKNCMI